MDATSRWFLDFWTINSMATKSSKQIMVSKGLQIRSYLVFKHTCLGLILFEANEVDKCSDVNIAQHIRNYPFERKSAHESSHPWSSWMGCCRFLHPTQYQHLVVKEIPKLKTTTDQTKIQTLIQEYHKESKFSTIRIGWNGSPTVLLCLRNPPKIHSTRLTIPSQPFFLKQCHGTSQGPEDRYHKQWSKVLKAKRSKFSVFLFASKKGSLWRMSFA